MSDSGHDRPGTPVIVDGGQEQWVVTEVAEIRRAPGTRIRILFEQSERSHYSDFSQAELAAFDVNQLRADAANFAAEALIKVVPLLNDSECELLSNILEVALTSRIRARLRQAAKSSNAPEAGSAPAVPVTMA